MIELTAALYPQVKMQDLLKTDHIYSSKKDDAMSRDDDEDAAEPLTGPSASSGPPTVEDHDGVISPLVVDNSAATAAKGPAPAGAADGPAPVEQLLLASTGQPLLRIPAVGLMFADTLYGAPTLLPELVNRWGAVHKILIIITIRQVLLPLTVAWNHFWCFQNLSDLSDCNCNVHFAKPITKPSILCLADKW